MFLSLGDTYVFCSTYIDTSLASRAGVWEQEEGRLKELAAIPWPLPECWQSQSDCNSYLWGLVITQPYVVQKA